MRKVSLGPRNLKMIKGGLGSILIKVAGILISILSTVVLARCMNPHDFGQYSYVIALITLLTVPAQFGLQDLVVRETANSEANNDWSRMRGIRYWASRTSVISSIFLMALTSATILTLYGKNREAHIFLFAIPLIILLAQSYLRAAALRGLRRVVLAQLPERIIRPLLLISFVIALQMFTGQEITAEQGMAGNLIVTLFCFILGSIILSKCTPSQYYANSDKTINSAIWLKSALPLAMISGIGELSRQIDIIVLGVFVSADDLGIYRVAVQGATLVTFGLSAGNILLAPYFARIYASGEMDRLKDLSRVSAAAIFVISLPVYLALLIWGREIMIFLFGVNFSSAALPLIIISTGQLVNAFTATATVILAMCGFEKETVRWLFISVVINTVLNFVLVPIFGIIGASIAAAISIAVQNMLLWRLAFEKIGFDISAYAFVHKLIRKSK